MNIGNSYSSTIESIKISLKETKYKFIAIIFGISAFAILYYFLVAKVANNSLWISVMMSGSGFITFSVVTILITSVLSGILFSMTLFKFNMYKSIEGKGIFGFIGSGIAAFGVGCPTCGAFLFGLIGLPLALTYLPFRGLELQIVGIIVLMLSIYFVGKSINGSCRILSKS